jgi:hypothetical protein
MSNNISQATKLNFTQLKNYMHTYKPVYSKIIGRGKSLLTSITGEDLEDAVKEAIFEGLYKAKEWYNFYSVLEEKYNNPSEIDLTENAGIKALLGSLEYSIRGLKDQTTTLLDTVSAASNSLSSNTFWGFEMQSEMWLDNLYDQLELLDELYGYEFNQNILSTLSALSANNEGIQDIYDRLNDLNLTQSYGVYKSNKNIDIDRIKINLIPLGGNFSTAEITDSLEFKNGLSQLSFTDGLSQGNYLLEFTNRNVVSISNIVAITGSTGKFEMTIGNNSVIGFLLNNEYPVIRQEPTNNSSMHILTIGGGFSYDSNITYKLYDYYIEPFSIFIESKVNKTDAIYDFFYGDFIDEKVEETDEEMIYNRKIYDTNKKLLVVYRMKVKKISDGSGLPTIEYEKIS